ncbi:hypothetical protein [Sutcliffiella cohnii]|nr:hypothetical protein [Sutcliffiella cohnii]
MELIIGAAIILIIFFSTSSIEKRLKNVENQNKQLLKLIEEIKEQNK